MKSKLLYLMLLSVVVWMSSCDNDSTEGLTRITYYPELVLDGDATVYIDKGSTFVDPGYSAFLNGEDVTDQIVVTSNVNTSVSGIYSISYSIENVDGFSASASRKVVVTDPNDPVEGLYDTDEDSYRITDAGATVVYGESYEILIINNGDGTYSVSDLLGGYYDQGRDYGSLYAMEGIITIDEEGTVELVDSYVAGWGDWASALEGTFDEATGTISWVVEYTTTPYYFHVIMYKR